MMTTLRLGTRGSALALWQAHHIARLLRGAWQGLQVEIVIVKTQGDARQEAALANFGGKGAFTAEIEEQLHRGDLDFAVHSLKDLPTSNPRGLTIAAVPERGPVQDVLVSRAGQTLETLPLGATVGTGSPRRKAQLLQQRPDLTIVGIRGNVDTRLNKALVESGDYQAIVLAQAGLERLGRHDVAPYSLPLEQMLPAPGQGALAVQCRDDDTSRRWFAPINHLETALSVHAERSFLAGLGSGCALPVAAYGVVVDGKLHLRGRVLSHDGQQQIEAEHATLAASVEEAEQLGLALAQVVVARGALALMTAS